ncbi:MAG TPA: GNAT family N-acetyltransferase [Gammaproteobacteria bacterium]|nr:GNAT family N-acetyltransferase [Gammaproteobacteria bacterium]
METYKHSIKNYYSFLKSTTRLDDLYTKSIPLENQAGYLLPISALHVDDAELIEKLAAWRKMHTTSFPSQFPVTLEGTATWLQKNLLDVEDRILFLVVNAHGQALGHLGFANGLNDQAELEIDNVLRGVHDQDPGIMSLAMKKLIEWAEEFIAPERIILRVFNDNLHAVAFYKKLGFVEDTLIPLKKHIEGEAIFYRESKDNQVDKHFLRMRYVTMPLLKAESLISTAGPSISAREISYANDAARYGWNSQWNKYIKKFEESFCEYLNVKYALSTSSCTGALHIALAALGIGPGDEVIVPDITWVATANAVVYVGATPVFADVDRDSWCMDPASFKSLITPRTKAVIPVHLYGHPAPIDEIVKIARAHGLYIIEDAAPSIGAEWKNQKVGTFGDFAAFSFQGAKLAVSGEGGVLITNNEELYYKAYAIWDQGREPNTFWIKQNGLKYKMANIQAAIGLGQMERILELIEAKRRIFHWYADNLQGVKDIRLNYETPHAYSIYWMASILVSEQCKLSRDELRAALKTYNVDTRPVFPAISQYPHWPRAQAAQPNATYIGNQAINLPSGVCLKKRDVDYICKSLKEILVKSTVGKQVELQD